MPNKYFTLCLLFISTLCHANTAEFNPYDFNFYSWGRHTQGDLEVVGISNSSYSDSPPLIFEIACEDKELSVYIRFSQKLKAELEEPWIRLRVGTNLKELPSKIIGMVAGNKIVLRNQVEVNILISLIVTTKLKRSASIHLETEDGKELGFIYMARDKKGFVTSVLKTCNNSLYKLNPYES